MGQSTSVVAGDRVDESYVVVGVVVEIAEVRVCLKPHGREEIHLGGITAFDGGQYSVEQPVGLLARSHTADVGRRAVRDTDGRSTGLRGRLHRTG